MNVQETILLIGVLVLGAGYAVGQFRKGRNDGEMATLNILGKKVTELERICTDQEKKIETLTDTVNRVEEQNKELKAILQNRDPRFVEFMTLVTRVATESETYMTEDRRKTDEIKDGISKLVGAMQSTKVS